MLGALVAAAVLPLVVLVDEDASGAVAAALLTAHICALGFFGVVADLSSHSFLFSSVEGL